MLVLMSSSSRGAGVFTLCELLSEIFSECQEVSGSQRRQAKGKKGAEIKRFDSHVGTGLLFLLQSRQ